MVNPLSKTLKRDLINDKGEYLTIFIFMVFFIAICSGFLITDNSVSSVYEESFDRYHVEDGHFDLAVPLSKDTLESIEALKVKVTEDFFKNIKVKKDQTIRIYSEREIVNQVDLLSGELPKNLNEIALDRLFSEVNNYPIGSMIETEDLSLKIVGLVALSDYSSLFETNSDMIFDASQFGVAVVNNKTFETLPQNLHYNYAWSYLDPSSDDQILKERSDKLLDLLDKETLITFQPAYSNKAITFTGEDMKSDKISIIILCYIMITIISFIFYVIISHKIKRDSKIIGTLRATGYSRTEIIIHYMTLPVLVAILAGIVGNILGYTYFISFFRTIYDTNYSLTSFELKTDFETFFLTTIIPVLILIVILLSTLSWKLRFSPQQFLTGSTSLKSFKIKFRLPDKMRFLTKFKTRIFISNLSTYLILFVGLYFAGLLVLFGFLLDPLLSHYEDDVIDNLLAQHQYLLISPYETQESSAQKLSLTTLSTLPNFYMEEDVLIYGVPEDNTYFKNLNSELRKLNGNEVIASENLMTKYDLKPGDTITLKEPYGNKEYTFKVYSGYDYPSSLALFLPQSYFNQLFEKPDGYYNAYLSDQVLTDIPENLILSHITQNDLIKVSRQLKSSFGAMTGLLKAVGLVISFFLIYLLTKVSIEKNEKSISLIKVLGFTKKEVLELYLVPVLIDVLLSLAIALPLANLTLKTIFESYLYTEMTGFIPYYIPISTFGYSALIILSSLLIVLLLEIRKINKIPKDLILKNVE